MFAIVAYLEDDVLHPMNATSNHQSMILVFVHERDLPIMFEVARALNQAVNPETGAVTGGATILRFAPLIGKQAMQSTLCFM